MLLWITVASGRMPDSQSTKPGLESRILPFQTLVIFVLSTMTLLTQLYKWVPCSGGNRWVNSLRRNCIMTECFSLVGMNRFVTGWNAERLCYKEYAFTFSVFVTRGCWTTLINWLRRRFVNSTRCWVCLDSTTPAETVFYRCIFKEKFAELCI